MSRQVRDAVSAGGVVFRGEPGALEVVLCGRQREQLWVLPKGTPDPGESLEETAVREVQEETGLLVHIGRPIKVIDYWFSADGGRVHKRVHHWLMHPAGGNVSNHDHEFDVVEWVSFPEALRRLTYPGERAVVEAAAGMLAAAP